MWIKTFGKYIELNHLQDHILKDCALVVEAQSFFYDSYRDSGLQYIFGCESDKYAEYLRSSLSMFKKANVKCYFVFKGGHEDVDKKLERISIRNNVLVGRYFDIYKKDEYFYKTNKKKYIVPPIFMKDVYKQVLDEMGFDYTICQYESKKECIALAQRLNCPIMSYDVELCFSRIPYIPFFNLSFDERRGGIKCGVFYLEEFLNKTNLTEEKFALFASLTDVRSFPETTFIEFAKSLGIPTVWYNMVKNEGILKWLPGVTRDEALNKIFGYSKVDREEFFEVEQRFMEMIRRQEVTGIPTEYLFNNNQIEVTQNDELWFEKGVVSKHIAIPLINLARHGKVLGTWAIADYTQEDAMVPSLDIIKYTYNLLTNFEKEHFVFIANNQETLVFLEDSIRKPNYNAATSPFENGWNHLNGELFEHFLAEALPNCDFEQLEGVPEDLKMIMTALVYYFVKKPEMPGSLKYGILLSYVALNTGVTVDNSINEHDKATAKCQLAKYLATVVGKDGAKKIMDRTLLHPMVEFQHCLEYMNYLNRLCGKLYKPTIYSKSFNGTFVYQVLYDIEKFFYGNGMDFIKKKLSAAPTVFAFIKSLLDAYDDILGNI